MNFLLLWGTATVAKSHMIEVVMAISISLSFLSSYQDLHGFDYCLWNITFQLLCVTTVLFTALITSHNSGRVGTRATDDAVLRMFGYWSFLH